MERLKGAPRRTALANASKRAAEAEQTAKTKESVLKKKTEEAEELQRRVELTRQCNRLMKGLTATLQKLDEAQKKLVVATDRADHLDAKVLALHAEADAFESKYQNSKKQLNLLITEMDSLAIN
ncbi:hypothetical protein BDZ97DRAFT_1755785 [Flammula alnicola]|nr:hypothetical protein BDZ97DRAFT_1755785 [Flammula alnicola]